MLFVNGHPDGPPLRSLGLQAYHQAGVFAAIGVLAALLAREHDRARPARRREPPGGGRRRRSSTCPASSIRPAASARRQGTLHWTRYFRVGRCRDGWVMHCTLGDWTSLVEWVKADGMARGPRRPAPGTTSRVRQAEAEHLFDVLDAWARALHGRRAGRGRAAPAHPVRGGAAARGAARRPAARRARLLRPDRASRRSGVDGARSPARPSASGDAPWRVAPAAAPRRAQRRGPRRRPRRRCSTRSRREALV